MSSSHLPPQPNPTSYLSDPASHTLDQSLLVQLLRQMAHDLRGPLATITGTSDMLAQGVYGELTSPQGRANERIRRSSARMLTLLDDFMTMVKADAGQLPLDSGPFEPRALLEKLRDQVASYAESKKLALHWSVAPDVPQTLRGDAGLISRMIAALLWNAVGYTSSGNVWLDAGWSGAGLWTVTVRDSGPGIAPDARSDIFKPFYRGEQWPQVPTSGFGLGLAMAFSVARMMQGQLTLEQSSASGSTFRIQLPLAVDEGLTASS